MRSSYPKLKVSKKSICVFICTIIAFLPISLSYLSIGGLLGILQDIMFLALMILFILNKVMGYWKYSISIYIKLALLFDILYFISTYINVGLQYNILTYAFKKFTLLCWIEYLIKHKEYKLIKSLTNALWMLIIIDFISVVLYPGGLYSFGIYGWFLGGKNNHFTYIFLASLLTMIDWYIASVKQKKKLFIKILILETISILIVILVKSSTSTITICILLSFFLLFKILREYKIFNMHTYMLIHSAIWVCIVLYNRILSDTLSKFLWILTGKDATFTGRVPIWRAILILIKEKPLMGYGLRSVSENIRMTGVSYYLNAHNQVLELLYTGGVILLAVFIIILVLCFIRNNKKKTTSNVLASWSIFALLFEFMQEAIMQEFLLWVILLVIYHANEIGDYKCILPCALSSQREYASVNELNSSFDASCTPCFEFEG